jgi:hypothetical protein
MPTNDPPDPYGNIVGVTTTTTTADPHWAKAIANTGNIDKIVWNGPITDRNRLENLDLTAYTEEELRGFAMLLAAYIHDKYPPKPPKFNSVEEADAWMEETYG